MPSAKKAGLRVFRLDLDVVPDHVIEGRIRGHAAVEQRVLGADLVIRQFVGFVAAILAVRGRRSSRGARRCRRR